MRMLIVAASVFLLASAALAQTGVGGGLPPQPRNPTRGQDAPQNASQQPPADQNAVGAVTCRVGDVAVFGNRVHVRCSALGQATDAATQAMANALRGGSGRGAAQGSLPTYYAVGLQSDPALANMTVSLATAAAAQNKQVRIMFNASAGGNPPGCQANDCRRLVGFMMLVMN